MIGNGIGEFKLAARKSSIAQINAAYSIVIEGKLKKLSSNNKWQERFFSLRGNSDQGYLCYSQKKNKEMKGIMPLESAIDAYLFTGITGQFVIVFDYDYHLKAPNKEVASYWVKKINTFIKKKSRANRFSMDDEDGESGNGSSITSLNDDRPEMFTPTSIPNRSRRASSVIKPQPYELQTFDTTNEILTCTSVDGSLRAEVDGNNFRLLDAEECTPIHELTFDLETIVYSLEFHEFELILTFEMQDGTKSILDLDTLELIENVPTDVDADDEEYDYTTETKTRVALAIVAAELSRTERTGLNVAVDCAMLFTRQSRVKLARLSSEKEQKRRLDIIDEISKSNIYERKQGLKKAISAITNEYTKRTNARNSAIVEAREESHRNRLEAIFIAVGQTEEVIDLYESDRLSINIKNEICRKLRVEESITLSEQERVTRVEARENIIVKNNEWAAEARYVAIKHVVDAQNTIQADYIQRVMTAALEDKESRRASVKKAIELAEIGRVEKINNNARMVLAKQMLEERANNIANVIAAADKERNRQRIELEVQLQCNEEEKKKSIDLSKRLAKLEQIRRNDIAYVNDSFTRKYKKDNIRTAIILAYEELKLRLTIPQRASSNRSPNTTTRKKVARHQRKKSLANNKKGGLTMVQKMKWKARGKESIYIILWLQSRIRFKLSKRRRRVSDVSGITTNTNYSTTSTSASNMMSRNNSRSSMITMDM